MSKESIVGAKAGSGDQPKPNIAPDSARSVTRLQQVIGLSEGEIKGFGVNNIKLDGTLLSVLSTSIKCDYRFGSSNQTSIDGVDEVANEIGVSVELRSDREWTKAITNTNLDALGLRLRWSPLVTNHENGDRTGVRIVYKVYIAPSSGSYALVLDGLIDDKTADSYERYHEFKLPPSNNGWMIRVVRETPNAESSLITDKMYVQAYSEIIKSKFNYPFTSLIALEYDAQTFPNIAKVSIEAEGMIIKVPTNYDPITRTYSGIWNGLFKLAYTNNPAWIYYDLVTNARYGLGDKIKVNMVDKWALYKLGMYCDQSISDGYGNMEPRFTCNVYLQSKERAYDILNRLTGLFRAINFWSGTEIVVDADIPQDTSYLYTNANVIDGLFEYAGTPATERYSVAKVAWDNPLNAYATEYEAVSYEHLIKELGFRVLELDAWGCTSRGQAIRAGRWALLAETDTITFKVGMDGYLALPGKVIEVQDEFYAGKSNGGRIKSIDATRKIITVDRDVSTIVGDILSINTNSGEVLKYSISSSVGKVITLQIALSQDIDILSIWVINSSTLVTQKYRVMTVKYDDVGEFTISATAYNSKKYEEVDNNIVFDDPPTSLINPIAQDSVTDVQIESTNLVYQGLNNVNLTIKWVRALNAVEYLVEFKKDNGTWLKLPTTGNNSITLDNVYAGTYLARVTAISAFGLHSLPAYSINTEVLGKLLPPSAPLNFRTSPAMFAVNVLWNFPANSKDVAYTRIQTSALNPLNMPDLTHVIEVDRAYPETKLTVDGMRIGYPKWFRAKLVDRLGFESPFTEWVIGESNEDPASVIELISGHISESALDQALNGKIDDAIAKANAAGEAATSAAQDVVQTIIPQLDALQEGITNVTTAYQDADANLLSTVDAYKISNDNAVASVLQKAESAVDTSTASAQEILAIKLSLDGVDEALGQKADTVIVDGITSTLEQQGDTLVAHTEALLSIDTTMEGLVDDIATKVDASMLDDYYTKLAADSAMAGRITTYAATVNQALGQKVNSATLTTNYYTSAATNQAIATATMTIRSDIADNGLFKNLINFEALLYGYYRAIGEIGGTADVTDAYDPNYYACTAGQRFAFTLRATGTGSFGSAGRMVWYTAAKVFISAADTHSKTKIGATVTVTAPSGAAFYRYSVIAKDADMTLVTGNAAVEIRETTSAVNGTSAAKVVTVDNDGVLSGYGLMSEIANGQVTSTFGVNASTFYIGAPANNKKPFIVLTSPGKINGVTVPAGTYIDTAFIADATIDTAQIRDLNVTTGKIANLAVTTAKIANLAVDTAQIASAAITTAKIDDLAVTTLKVVGNAITANAAIYTEAETVYTEFDTEYTIASLVMNAAGGSVIINFAMSYLKAPLYSSGSDPRITIRIKRGTIVLRTSTFYGGNSMPLLDEWINPNGNSWGYNSDVGVFLYDFALPLLVDTPPSGNQTYSVTVERRGMNAGGGTNTRTHTRIKGRSLMILGAKR